MPAYMMASLVKSLSVKGFAETDLALTVNDRTNTYLILNTLMFKAVDCSWSHVRVSESGPYGSRNSMPGHANPLQTHTE